LQGIVINCSKSIIFSSKSFHLRSHARQRLSLEKVVSELAADIVAILQGRNPESLPINDMTAICVDHIWVVKISDHKLLVRL